MNTVLFTNKFNLSETNGWQITPFNSKGKDSFYTFMIENNELSIAWVALCNGMKLEEINAHYFRREDPLKSGHKNFHPRLLIAYNGRRWYVADMSINHFVTLKEEDLTRKIATELDLILSQSNLINYSPNTLRQIGQTKTRIEQDSFIIADPFAGSGQLNTNKNWDDFVDNADKSKMLWLQKRNALMEKEFDKLSYEFKRQNQLLHTILLEQITTEQLKALKAILGFNNYINPFWKPEEGIVIKIVQDSFFGKKLGIEAKAKSYAIMDKLGKIRVLNTKSIDLNDSDFLEGFFRLNLMYLS
jgi:hypothetical protein